MFNAVTFSSNIADLWLGHMADDSATVEIYMKSKVNYLMDVLSEGPIVAVVERWHATNHPHFGMDRQYIHFGSECRSSKLSHGTKYR